MHGLKDLLIIILLLKCIKVSFLCPESLLLVSFLSKYGLLKSPIGDFEGSPKKVRTLEMGLFLTFSVFELQRGYLYQLLRGYTRTFPLLSVM